MISANDLFITEYREFFADLYRNGNSSHPRLDNVRPGHDAHTYLVNDVVWIRADGNGVSAFTDYDKTRKNWWKIPKGLPLPAKLKIVKDIRPGFDNHYMVAPAFDMPLSEYIMLMDQIRAKCQRVT
jgi:hypothetical protein